MNTFFMKQCSVANTCLDLPTTLTKIHDSLSTICLAKDDIQSPWSCHDKYLDAEKL